MPAWPPHDHRGGLLAKAKKGKEPAPKMAVARVKTEPVYVAHAMLPDKAVASDARRVLSSYEQMRRAGQLGDAEALAAEIFRDAFDAVSASMGGAMDFDRARGGGVGSSIAPGVLLAAARLNEAARLLYDEDYAIVARVVGEGSTLADCVRDVAGSKDEACRNIGRRLRVALAELARAWVQSRPGRARPWHAPDAVSRTRADDAEPIARGTVAHAARHRVRES